MAAREGVAFRVACGLAFFAAAALDVFFTADDAGDFFTAGDLGDFFTAGDLDDFFTAADLDVFFAAIDLRLAVAAGRAFFATGRDAAFRAGFAAGFAARRGWAAPAFRLAFLAPRLAEPCLVFAMSLAL